MHKIVSNILKLFEYVLITCILFISIIVAINFVQLNIMKKDYTNFMSYSIFKVISDSMAPTIVKNDVIIVKINDEIKKGDIITYKLKD
ncbi:MAG: S26 family signal peptidase, partial [Bacilli bacterium]|nr:S26 family signal peptidase [Bacilli bacterium]